MNALGCIADFNSPALPLRLSAVFPNVTRTEPELCYEHTPENLLSSWAACAAITLFCCLASIISLRLRNKCN